MTANDDKGQDRREFLQSAAVAAAGLGVAGSRSAAHAASDGPARTEIRNVGLMSPGDACARA